MKLLRQTFPDVLENTPRNQLDVEFEGDEAQCIIYALSRGCVHHDSRREPLGYYWYRKPDLCFLVEE